MGVLFAGSVSVLARSHAGHSRGFLPGCILNHLAPSALGSERQGKLVL